MPIKKNDGESKQDFISRCMSDEASAFPDEKQRYAVCAGYWTDAAVSDSMPSMIKFTDAAKIGGIKKTQEGYLIATSKVARTGSQNYRARELGDVAIAAGFDSNDIVRVYRHEDQVFHKDTLSSITRVPVTIDHPSEMVDADNYSQYAVGDVGDAFKQDGDWIVVNPMIKDAAAVKAAQSTHKEISMGYSAEIVAARDGVDADFEMVNIRMNHLALVPRGRAGSQARIGDAQTWGASPVTVEDEEMTVELKTVILGDKSVQVEAKDVATVAAILKDHQTAIDAKDAEIAVKDAEIKALKDAQLTDEQIEAMIEEKNGKRKKREEVEAKIGDKAKGFTDEQIEVAHSLLDQFVDNTVRKAIGANVRDQAVTDGVSAWDAIYPKKGA